MKYRYEPIGTCSRAIDIEVDGGVIVSVTFKGGCMGNTQGLGALIRGMKVDDAVSRLRGIQCGAKGTSCPDQLAVALQQIAREH